MFSAILNFWIFCDKVTTERDNIIERIEADVLRRNTLIKEIEEIKVSINEKIEGHIQNEKLIEQVRNSQLLTMISLSLTY